MHVTRPSLGRLQLDDGDSVELDHDLLIGRNPDRDTDPSRAALRRVKAIGDKVSRSHLEVRLQGWDIFVVDCGSTNGTFVVPHAGGQVVPVDPGRPQLVEPGATVYFGSRSFTVLGRARVTVTDTGLRVDFCGEQTSVPLGDELTFGRQADLHIDDNRHLHRVLGRFWARGDAWWLTNEGRSITIQIADADSRSSVTLAPGSEIALSFPNSILRFRAGVTDYEVVVAVPDRGAGEGDDEDDPLDADADELETIALGDLLLDRRAAAAAARPRRGCAARPPRRRRPADEPGRRPPPRLVDHQVQPQARQPLQPLHQARRRWPARVDRPARHGPPAPARRARHRVRPDHPFAALRAAPGTGLTHVLRKIRPS